MRWVFSIVILNPPIFLFDQDNNLYLTDFGIVTWLGEKPGYDGHMMGTPHYIAPEILEGNVDERSEVYSVGILLYRDAYRLRANRWTKR